MQVREYRNRNYSLSVICGMNHRYHQAYATFWRAWDRCIKIVVVIMTVVSLVMSVPGFDYPWTALWLAVISSVAAFAMNIIPVGDWDKEHSEMYRLWSDLRSDVDAEELKVCMKSEDDTVNGNVIDRLTELQTKSNALHSMERSVDRPFLEQCLNEETASRLPATTCSAGVVEVAKVPAQAAPAEKVDGAAGGSCASPQAERDNLVA
jgi:hypothetical protein